MNISILIQGNLHINSIECLEYYSSKVSSVVYSTYYPKDERENDLYIKLKSIDISNIHLIFSPYPDTTNICNIQNSYYQIFSTLNGLKNIVSDYTIKIRSSVGLKNIDPLLDMIKITNKQIISINIGFAKTYNTLYHPSDHIFAMSTKLMYKTFEILNDRFIKNYNWVSNGFVHSDNTNIVIENKICCVCLELLGMKIDFKSVDKCKSQMIKVYDIIDVNLLEPIYYTSVFSGNKFEGKIYEYFAKHIIEI